MVSMRPPRGILNGGSTLAPVSGSIEPILHQTRFVTFLNFCFFDTLIENLKEKKYNTPKLF